MRKFYFTLLIVMATVLSGCSNYILKTHYATAPGFEDGIIFREVNRTIYWWGIAENRAVHVDSICEETDDPLSEVRVKKSFYQSLVGIITIGIVNTSTIEYACGQK